MSEKTCGRCIRKPARFSNGFRSTVDLDCKYTRALTFLRICTRNDFGVELEDLLNPIKVVRYANDSRSLLAVY